MLIAIDPSYSKKLGIAWTNDGKEIEYTSIWDKEDYAKETRDIQQMCLKAYDFLVDLIADNKDITVIIEDQYLGLNVRTYAGLLEMRAFLTGMLKSHYRNAIIIKQVSPMTWHSKIFNNHKLKSEVLKEKSIKYASELTKKNPSEDESDAICILKYAIDYC